MLEVLHVCQEFGHRAQAHLAPLDNTTALLTSQKKELVKIPDRSAALLKSNLTLAGPLLASVLQFSVGFFSVFVPVVLAV